MAYRKAILKEYFMDSSTVLIHSSTSPPLKEQLFIFTISPSLEIIAKA
jgi:hypothetical protein